MYIAKKVQKFAGVEYIIGDRIPDDAIRPDRVSDLVKMGVIEVVSDGLEVTTMEEGKVTFPVSVNTDNGGFLLNLTAEETAEVFTALQSNAETVAEIVSTTTSENVLILIDAIDKRKSVKELVRNRVHELKEQSEE